MIEIRDLQEIVNLDQELNLFDDNDWDFLSNSNTEVAGNYEYYNDIRDIDFDGASNSFLKRDYIIVFLLVLLTILSLFICLNIMGVFDRNLDYEALQTVADSEGMTSTEEYIQGEECGNDKIIETSKVLSHYCGVLKSDAKLVTLNDYCEGDSVFYTNYKSYTDNIKESYDLNDCYARAFSKFGTMFSIDEINKVIYKDGIYYCYVNIYAPTENDIFQYIYMYQYDIAKYFNSRDISEENIVRFLLEITGQSVIPCSSNEYCIEFVESDNGLVIKDDTFFSDTSIVSFKSSTEKITNIIKGNIQK